MKSCNISLAAWRRVPFGGAAGDQDFVVMGQDYSAANFAMQVRDAPGDTGTALATLVNSAAGSQGISATYDPTYIHPVTGQAVGATIICPQIDQATLAAMPMAPDDPADALTLSYDLRVTPPGLPSFILAYGPFILNPGVTI